MNRQVLQKQKLPDAPGVYFFLGRKQRAGGKNGREVLYVGKATSLRNRVRSYFLTGAVMSRGPKIPKLISETAAIAVEKTDSVLEALIKESALIKRHQPRYNVSEKGDTSFNYVVITNETFPRVFTIRERELLKAVEARKLTRLQAHFGPFPHGGQLKEAMKLVRKIFPYRGKTDAPLRGTRRRASTLYEELGLAPKSGGGADPKEYQKTIRHLVLFFEGKKKELLRSLERTMKTYAKAKHFEAAGETKRQLFALRHISDVSLLKQTTSNKQQTMRIEAFDVAHTMGTDVVGAMTVVEDGVPAKKDYRMFKINGKRKPNKANATREARFINDTAALAEILTRRFGHPEWPYPRLIVVDGGTAQLRAAQKTLKSIGIGVPVVAVTKNERHRPEKLLGDVKLIDAHGREILLANSEAHRFAIGFHRRRQRRGRF